MEIEKEIMGERREREISLSSVWMRNEETAS